MNLQKELFVNHHVEEFVEDIESLETEDDISDLNKNIFTEAVVHATDWTTETIINQIDKGNIKLNPNFQRRDAWDKDRKSRFIESLILGLPIPQIVLAESKEKRGSYIVLDGKQRLLSIRQFAAKKGDEIYEQLKLSSLEIRDDLKGLTLEDLNNNILSTDDLASFENQPIRTVVIKNWPNDDFLYHVFLRLNTGSVPLSPQELRQALIPGTFVTYLDKESADSLSLREILKIKKPDFRMRDTELLLRYYAFKNFLSEYKGNLKYFLDYCCEILNKEWNIREQQIKEQLDSFEQAHAYIKSIFGNNSYHKWIGNEYESRFNRAIYDVMILSFSEGAVRGLGENRKTDIENAFKALCNDSQDFKTSIETTTKSLQATQIRISLWNSKLNETIGSNLPVPQIINNRIV